MLPFLGPSGEKHVGLKGRESQGRMVGWTASSSSLCGVI